MKYGKMPRKDILSEEGFPVFSGYRITGYAKEYLWAEPRVIVVARGVGGTGDVKMSPEKAWITNLSIVLDHDESLVDRQYLYYKLGLEPLRDKLNTGAAQAQITIDSLSPYVIRLPDLEAQKRITAILSAYDDLIENNRRRIQLLEQAARLLYKEWFVHLRFPGHEHVKIKDGVPEGWEKKPLSEIADITMGQSPKSIYYNQDGNGLPFHQGVSNFRVRFPTHETYCTVQNRTAEPGDILFSVRAPVGRINITPDKIVIGRGLAAIRSNCNQQNYLFYALKSHFFKEDMIGGGAIFAAITKKDLHGVELMQPTDRIAAMFMEHVLPIDLQIVNLQQTIERLAKARDLLLPRLMNGEIAV
ncbi:MAG: restriction endonuclease subunit S [Candidatus Zixiibacteriota bacterium]